MPPPNNKGRPKKKGGKKKKKKPNDLETKKEKLLKWYTVVIDQIGEQDAGKLQREQTALTKLELVEVNELRHRDVVFQRISRAIDEMKAKEQHLIDDYDNRCQQTYDEMIRTEKQQAEKLMQVLAKIKHFVLLVAQHERILAELIYFRDVGSKILAKRIARLQLELDHLQSAYETLSREMLQDRDAYLVMIARQVEEALARVPRQVFNQLMHALPADKHQLLLNNWWMTKELHKNKQFFEQLSQAIVVAEQINVHKCGVIQRLARDYYKSLSQSGFLCVGSEDDYEQQLRALLGDAPAHDEQLCITDGSDQLADIIPPFTDTFPDRQTIFDSVTLNRRCLKVRGRQMPIHVLPVARNEFTNELNMELRQNVGVLDDYLTEIYENLDGFAPQAEDTPPILYSQVWDKGKADKRQDDVSKLPPYFLKYLAQDNRGKSTIAPATSQYPADDGDFNTVVPAESCIVPEDLSDT